MRQKILLIQPPIDEIVPSTYRPSLGLPYIASELQTNTTTEVKILDLLIEKARDANFDLEKFVSSRGPFDIVGISIVSPALKSSLAIARTVKKISPQTILVAGGYHPSIRPAELLKGSPFDIAVVGEGEKTFVEIVASKNLSQDLPLIKGIYFKSKEGDIRSTSSRPLVNNLDELAFPNLGLMPLEKYSPYDLGIKVEKYLPILSSRGCPYGCIFCSKQVFGQTHRMRSAENVVAEIEHLIKNYGIRSFYFQDDTFTFSHSRVEKICDLLIKKNLSTKWWCFTRADLPKSLMQKMSKAGCIELMFGIESGDPVVIELIKKNLDLGKAAETIQCAHDLGILTRCFFMVGLPKQDKKSIQKTIEFIRRTKPDIISVCILTPYPGTEIQKNAAAYGIEIIEPETPNGLVQYQDTAEYGRIAISTKWMRKGEILDSVNEIYQAFWQTKGKKAGEN